MAKKIDLVGRVFGLLTVVSQHGRIGAKVAWLCRCSCGTEKTVIGDSLRSGKTTSCGCKMIGRVKHGKHGSRVYRSWKSMLARCRSEDPYYGGRGIEVCPRWASFENFYQDMGDPPPGTTLDRRENALGYCPENCRWATPKGQTRNRRNTVWLTFRGEEKPLAEWCEALGADFDVTRSRLKLGWSAEEAFFGKSSSSAHLRPSRV